MEFKLLENTADIRAAFIERFVMPWEQFRVVLKDWIAEMKNTRYPIGKAWYDRSYMWTRMHPDFPHVSMAEALAFLRRHGGPVLFMSENIENYGGRSKLPLGFIAEADARALAARIEQEWYDDYRLGMQNMYDPDAFLPSEVYVFDLSMKWCVVFTHETTDWESELDDPMKAAESRYCIICNL